jgi:hypothetical protein
MSTQYTDHDTLECAAPQRIALRNNLHGTPRSSQPVTEPLLDHHQLATRWLIQEECIQALRVADPTRARFTPFRQTPDPDSPQQLLPDARRNLNVNAPRSGYPAPLNIRLRWVIWRNPYGTHE